MEAAEDKIIEKEELDADIEGVVEKVNNYAIATDTPARVKKSTITEAGYGLFARKYIEPGALITLYGGKMISSDEAANLSKTERDYLYAFPQELVEIFIEGIKNPKRKQYLCNLAKTWEGTYRDPRVNFRFSEMGRWINDARDNGRQNAVVTYEGIYNNNSWKIGFRAMRDIHEGDEIFFSYGNEYWEQEEERELKKLKRLGKCIHCRERRAKWQEVVVSGNVFCSLVCQQQYYY